MACACELRQQACRNWPVRGWCHKLGNNILVELEDPADTADNEVLHSAFRIPHDAPPRWLFVLTAYIDESNHTSDDWMSVAGFFGTDEQWKAYVPAWKEAISPRNDLHMSELRFNSRKDRIRRTLEKAGAVPDKCGLTPIFGAVRYSDYSDLVSSEDEKVYCGYISCCFPMVLQTLRGIPPNERIELVFERQDKHWEMIELALWTVVHFASAETRLPTGRSKLANWRSVEKSSTSLTEVADYLAYSLVQHHKDAKSLRAKWCSPILKSSGGSGFGRIQSREKNRRLVSRAQMLFKLGNELPKLYRPNLDTTAPANPVDAEPTA